MVENALTVCTFIAAATFLAGCQTPPAAAAAAALAALALEAWLRSVRGSLSITEHCAVSTFHENLKVGVEIEITMQKMHILIDESEIGAMK